ncbi:MAG: thiamine phosphate synthase [Oscillibacter sp.]|nr:thiamine phosphate synthase [Oscillibacter sp.]
MKFTKDEVRKAMLLYAVTDQMWLKEGEALADVVESVLRNGATFLQIREKDLAQDAFEVEAERLKTLCAQHGVPFVVNDSVEIALKIGADGVHVGQSDIKGRDIRSIIGTDKILGISAGTVEEAIAAEKAGADYIGVGAVFPTGTKKNATPMTMELLKEIVSSVSIPVVAIGGIGAGNILQLCGSGVDGVAVVSAIFAAEDPGKATADLLKLAEEVVASNG